MLERRVGNHDPILFAVCPINVARQPIDADSIDAEANAMEISLVRSILCENEK